MPRGASGSAMSRAPIAFDPEVPVFDPYAKSFPKFAEGEPATYGPFSEAASTVWEWDAHTCAASCPAIPRRLGTAGAYAYKPKMVLFVLDVDGPDHRRTPAWDAEIQKKVGAFFKKYGRGYCYATRGGVRIVMGLRDELMIDSPQAATRWRLSYLEWIAKIETEFGIVSDDKCADVFHLFRLPRVRRNGVDVVPDFELGESDRMLEWREPYVAADDPRVLAGGASGEQVDLPPFDGLPSYDKLAEAVEALGDAWPARSRHYASLALCGALARAGWPEEYIGGFVEDVVTRAGGNPEPDKRLAQAHDAVERLHRNENVTGWPALEDHMITGLDGQPDESRRKLVQSAIATARRALGMAAPIELFDVVLRRRAADTTWTPPIELAKVPSRTVTIDELEAYYRMLREDLSRADDVLARVDAKYLDRLKRKASKPMHDEGENPDDVVAAVAVALVRRAPGGVDDDRLAAILEPRLGPRSSDVITMARASLSTAPHDVKIEPAVPAANDAEQKSQATKLLEIVEKLGAELFHDAAGGRFATVPTPMRGSDKLGHATYSIDSRAFRDWLDYAYYQGAGSTALSEQARQGVVNMLRARALYEGAEYRVFVRVGDHDGRIYVDLCDGTGRAVEVDAAGWRVVDEPPVRFLRHRSMLALPEPTRDPQIDLGKLWDFVLVREEDRLRVLIWLVGAINPRGPYHVLVLTGRHGSIKTGTQRALRQLIDPNEAPLRLKLGDGRDIMISAISSWVQSYDNLAPIGVEASNALCCLATGGAYATRTLTTDTDETILRAQRPVALNGIEDIVTAGDLLDRAIRIDCPKFTGARRTEKDVDADFERSHPALLGALLDAVACALKHLPEVAKRTDVAWPRMADAAMFAAAAAPALGTDLRSVVAALSEGVSASDLIVLEQSAIAAHLREIAVEGFTGSATQLLEAIKRRTPFDKVKDLPKAPNMLSGELRKIASALERAYKLEIVFEAERNKRWITLRIAPEPAAEVGS